MIMRKGHLDLQQQPELQTRQSAHSLQHRFVNVVQRNTGRRRQAHASIQGPLTAGWSWLNDLKSDLVASLGTPSIGLARPDSQPRLFNRQAESGPVGLLPLVESLPHLTRQTAILGLDHDDRPLLLNLNGADVTNILVAGGPAAGKSGLLRTLTLSLAMTNRQSNVQLVIFDCQGATEQPFSGQLYPLSYLPHMMCPIVESVTEAASTLGFLANEVAYRQEQPVTEPLIVALIDNVDELVVAGGSPIQELLGYLLREGPDAGVRLFLAARNPAVPELRPLLLGNIAIRLVGRAADAHQAQVATGQADSRAEYLSGRGDFLAVAGGGIFPFQAAYVSDYDLHLSLERLHNQSRRTTVLARPLNGPGQALVEEEVEETGQNLYTKSFREPNGLQVDFPVVPVTAGAADRVGIPSGDPAAPVEWARDQLSRVASDVTDPAREPPVYPGQTERAPNWSDAFFDFLNTASLAQPATAVEISDQPAKRTAFESSAGPSAPEEEFWDDFWHNEENWREADHQPASSPEPLPAEPATAAELIYVDIEDDLAGLEAEDESPRADPIEEE
jgi:hypothetical protein